MSGAERIIDIGVPQLSQALREIFITRSFLRVKPEVLQQEHLSGLQCFSHTPGFRSNAIGSEADFPLQQAGNMRENMAE